MSSGNTEYYRMRAAVECRMALAADRQDVAAVHEELARLYEALVGEPKLRPTFRIVPAERLSA